MRTEQQLLRQVLRAQAWERAKGELQSMLFTFYGEVEQCEELDTAIREFVSRIEDGDAL